jgi:hypothetical protein
VWLRSGAPAPTAISAPVVALRRCATRLLSPPWQVAPERTRRTSHRNFWRERLRLARHLLPVVLFGTRDCRYGRRLSDKSRSRSAGPFRRDRFASRPARRRLERLCGRRRFRRERPERIARQPRRLGAAAARGPQLRNRAIAVGRRCVGTACAGEVAQVADAHVQAHHAVPVGVHPSQGGRRAALPRLPRAVERAKRVARFGCGGRYVSAGELLHT